MAGIQVRMCRCPIVLKGRLSLRNGAGNIAFGAVSLLHRNGRNANNNNCEEHQQIAQFSDVAFLKHFQTTPAPTHNPFVRETRGVGARHCGIGQDQKPDAWPL